MTHCDFSFRHYLLNKFNGLFTQTHPGIKFTMLLKGSSTGIGGLTAGVSAFAPMGREKERDRPSVGPIPIMKARRGRP